MGQRAMKIADVAEYLRVLSAPLRSAVVDYLPTHLIRPASIHARPKARHVWRYAWL